MAIRSVLKMGHPVLAQVAEKIDAFDTPELHDLIKDLFDTMHAYKGVGIAAPQIGVSQQVVIFGFDKNPRYPDAEAVPQTILINPHITFLGDEEELGWEGCLSVPGLRGEVSRFAKIRYQGFDVQGKAIDRLAEGFHARVVQHECDHLWGILYPQRMRDLKRLGFLGALPGTTQLDDVD